MDRTFEMHFISVLTCEQIYLGRTGQSAEKPVELTWSEYVRSPCMWVLREPKEIKEVVVGGGDSWLWCALLASC